MVDQTGARIDDLEAANWQLSRYAAMLDAISYAAVSLIGRDDWQSEVDTLIARLGRATDVSRVVIFEIESLASGRLVQTCRFEWSADGVELIKDAPDNQAEDLMTTDAGGRAWLQRRLNGEVVQTLVRDLDGYLQAKFAGEGILSLVTVPIMVDGRLWGHIDFDDCQRERIWGTAEINALKTVAGLLAQFIERARMEQQMAEQREALHQADKMSALGSLLAGIAHELNNPLTVLIGQSMLLQEALSDDRLGTRAAKIRAAAERCGRIVKVFLAMARQQPTAYVETPLAPLLDDVLELVSYGVRSGAIDISHRVDPTLPALWADKDQLSQLLLNLVINAQQALLEVSGRRLLRVHAHRATLGEGMPAALIEIADSGPGIPAALRARIFEPFFTTKPAGMGTGIGLSLCHGIVVNHGGMIEVDDAPEGGALFRVLLPINSPARSASPNPTCPAEQPASTEQASILVVDDEPEIAITLADMLEQIGYRSVLADGGRQALQQLEKQPFALIISDLRMPDLDGIGLYQALVANYPDMIRRLIFMTGDTLQSGALVERLPSKVPLLEKPFLPADVQRAVTRVLAAEDSEP